MLNANIKAIRKSKGLSQEELAVKLNVVRQTISKWEQGLSVPDSDMLISIAEALETPVSILLGETVAESGSDDLKTLSEKLEIHKPAACATKGCEAEDVSLVAYLVVRVHSNGLGSFDHIK